MLKLTLNTLKLDPLSFSAFRANARNVLERNVLVATCPGCDRLSVLVLNGFGDDGSVGLVCMRCGASLDATPDKQIWLNYRADASGKSYRNILRQALKERGVDWQTGQPTGERGDNKRSDYP